MQKTINNLKENAKYPISILILMGIILSVVAFALPTIANAANDIEVIAGFEYTAATATERKDSYPATSGENRANAQIEFTYAAGVVAQIGRTQADREPLNVPNTPIDGWFQGNDFSAGNAAGWIITLDTTGYASDLKFTASQSSSNQGPAQFALAYRIGDTGGWTDISGATATITTAGDTMGKTFDNAELPDAMGDKAVVQLKVYITSAVNRSGGALAADNGNTSINNILITGEAIPQPEPFYNLPATYETMITHLGSYSTGFTNADGGVAEIVVYNKDNQKMYLVNGADQSLDIVSLAGITAGAVNTFTLDKRIDVESLGEDNGFSGGDITSVSVNTRLKVLAISVQKGDYDDDYAENGYIVFLDYDGGYIAHYEAGCQPDMLGFSPDNNYVMTADEGERRNFSDNSVDPEGSVTIIDLSEIDSHNDLKTIADDKITTVGFHAFDTEEKRAELVANGVLLKVGTAPSVDLEPEYIAFSEDSKTAYVSLQEANAIATFDIETKTFTSIKGLGFKDHSLTGNELDLRSDADIKIANEPVFGVYMPDGLATVNIGGVQYVL